MGGILKKVSSNLKKEMFPIVQFSWPPFNHLSSIVKWIMVVQFINHGPFPILTTLLITLLEANYQVWKTLEPCWLQILKRLSFLSLKCCHTIFIFLNYCDLCFLIY
jgi:hypothetical protein